MRVYRISKCKYIDDLSGKGAASFPGRWNGKGVHVVYTAQSASLALLESVVHLSSIPTITYCMLTLEIPDLSIQELPAADLPKDWEQNPPDEKLKNIGNRFVEEAKFLALKIPSAIMPEEFNYILNPNHKQFNLVKILSNRNLSIDERLLRK